MASTKTPISLLQEILQQQRKPSPMYKEVPSDLSQYPFKCIVTFESVEAYGYAFTKKEAKQNCAQQALLKIGVGSSSAYINHNNNVTKSAVVPVNVVNYTGKLHEHAAANHVPSPNYWDKIPQNGLFVVECTFMKFTTEGQGTTKKQAKQEASRAMIEKLEIEDVNYKGFQKVSPIIENTDFTNQILKRYEQMSMKDDQTIVPVTNSVLPKVEIEKEQYTFEELVIKLRSIGHECKIEVFQRDPYIMVFRIGQNSCVAMGHGKTKEEATDDLFTKTSIMFDAGFSFKSLS